MKKNQFLTLATTACSLIAPVKYVATEAGELEWLIDDKVPGKKYYSYETNEDVISVYGAVKQCKGIGAVLPEPKTMEETNFLSTLVIWQTGFYLGLNDSKKEGTWLWHTDSSPVTYNAWGLHGGSKQNEPNGGKQENCAALTKEGFRYAAWADVPCFDRQRQVVCEAGSISATTPATTPATTTAKPTAKPAAAPAKPPTASSGIVDMVHPNPIVKSQSFYVKCAVGCIGGVDRLEGIAKSLIVEQLSLHQKMPDGSLAKIAQYEAFNDGRKEWGYFPKGVEKSQVRMDKGEGPDGDSKRNAMTAKILMVVENASREHAIEYKCTIKYRTNDGTKEKSFSQTPAFDNLEQGVESDPENDYDAGNVTNENGDNGVDGKNENDDQPRDTTKRKEEESKAWHAVLLFGAVGLFATFICCGVFIEICMSLGVLFYSTQSKKASGNEVDQDSSSRTIDDATEQMKTDTEYQQKPTRTTVNTMNQRLPYIPREEAKELSDSSSDSSSSTLS